MGLAFTDIYQGNTPVSGQGREPGDTKKRDRAAVNPGSANNSANMWVVLVLALIGVRLIWEKAK